MQDRLKTVFGTLGRRLPVVLLLALAPNVCGGERLQLQVGVGLADPIAPAYLADYWDYGVEFSFGFGGRVNEQWFFNMIYSHLTFDYSESVEPLGDNAALNSMMLNFRRRLPIARSDRAMPFASVAAGFTLLKTPAVYEDVDAVIGTVLPENKLADAQQEAGLALRVGMGVNYELEETTLLFTELYASCARLAGPNFYAWGVRAGVMFGL